MVLFEAGKLLNKNFVDISRLKELKSIHETNDAIELGALVTYSEILENKSLQSHYPLLCEAAKVTGALAIQNRGTIGGNIVNASPAADSPLVLLVYESELELTSKGNRRWLPYEKFHRGYKKTELRPGEIVTRIKINKPSINAKQAYWKVGTRKAQAISKICMAILLEKKQNKVEKIKIAFGSVAPTPVRCFKIEAFLIGKELDAKVIQQAVQLLNGEITPIDDIRSTQEYRLTVAGHMLAEKLRSL
jgi:CO/xanthine dehydrogenase FAD-binding subunit